MNYSDHGSYIEIDIPEHFAYEHCLIYLARSEVECLHRVIDNAVFKVIDIKGDLLMLKISDSINSLKVEFLNKIPAQEEKTYTAEYVWNLFDLGTDVTEFYKLAKTDGILSNLVEKYYGLRIIKINDLFEGVCWAIIGQQINLKFAYTLKKRLCESYGKKYEYDGQIYYVFPEPETISDLSVENLRELQFTGRKSEYLIGVGKLFNEGKMSRRYLESLNGYDAVRKALMDIRGIGNWTADYAILKCFNYHEAFPIADVGIHNGLKVLLGREKKPKVDEILQLSEPWAGWEAYATFFIWRSLYN